jgi:heme A synthase
MQIPLIITLSLHVLSSVFWAGSSFTLARTGGLGSEKLFRPQMGAAVIAILTGAFTALVAAGVQGAIGGRAVRSLCSGTADETGARLRIAVAQRIAAVLLAVTALCMGAARYA